KAALKASQVTITCYDRNGKEVKRVNSSDPGTESPDESGSGGESGGGSCNEDGGGSLIYAEGRVRKRPCPNKTGERHAAKPRQIGAQYATIVAQPPPM
ncbi:MAG: hypothetical protein PUD75_01180, partial [Prevotella sp.]|nr:hypothetical protein [Prevotella sp.]